MAANAQAAFNVKGKARFQDVDETRVFEAFTCGQQAVLVCDLRGPVPKVVRRFELAVQDFPSDFVFPIGVQIAVLDFIHEFGKSEGLKVLPVRVDPVTHMAIVDGGHGQGDLLFRRGVLYAKVVHAAEFKARSDVRHEDTLGDNWELGWISVVQGSVFRMGRHFEADGRQ
jgi:hypothetical protein